MRRSATLLFISLMAAASSGPQAQAPRGVNLAALEGWDIVIAESPSPAVAYAAEELQRFLEKASGLRLPVTSKVEGKDRHVFVGASGPMRDSPAGFGVEGLGPEDLRIVIRDGAIAIAGGEPRGTLYGVYAFLEDHLGVRFLTTDHTHVPPAGAWRVVGPVDRTFRPPFAMRWSYYGEVNRDPVFAARLRVNTVTGDPKLGGKTGIQNINHSFLRQIPSQKYGKEHPEYYCWIDGKRIAEVKSDAYDNEPCLTNPEVLRIVTEAVLAEIEHSPGTANVSVSQNDNNKYCRCEKCAAIDEREGTPMGSILTFVNAVADEVAKRHPGVLVGTLSYWYSRKPPRTIQPRPNVQIQLCSIECCLIHPIDDPACPKNAEFCRDMRGWGAISKNVSIWNYNTNFSNYLLPCPNLRVIEPNVRFFAANKATGIFMQAAGNAWAAELSDLRNYVISSLIWDPSRSGARLVDEFVSLHYGRAAPPIRRYMNLVHDTAEASGLHRNCFAGKGEQYGLTSEMASQAVALFEIALGLAESPEVASRVEKASLGAYRLAIDPVWGRQDASGLDAGLLAKTRPLVSRFLELCAKHAVDQSSENEPFAKARERLEKLLAVR
ncbi:MAG: DUF4838 domain-containing protein [Planctomycetes bacterium]|nr:DUF4838 domain-containing protein [Planctomycetota bacterium]